MRESDCFVADSAPRNDRGLFKMGERMEKFYYVYIMTNKSNGVLYTGVTGEFEVRVWDHRNKALKGFTSRYNANKLVWFEEFEDVNEAIAREKQIKAGSRKKKISLIECKNPEWRDLSEGWYDDEVIQIASSAPKIGASSQ